jgi:hypothetical protein
MNKNLTLDTSNHVISDDITTKKRIKKEKKKRQKEFGVALGG